MLRRALPLVLIVVAAIGGMWALGVPSYVTWTLTSLGLLTGSIAGLALVLRRHERDATRRRLIGATVCLVGLVAFGLSNRMIVVDPGIIGASKTSADPALVSSAMLRDKWPFRVGSGRLVCDVDYGRQLVRLDVGNGIQYGLNGAARQAGFPDALAELLPGRTPADLSGLIEQGLRLCEER